MCGSTVAGAVTCSKCCRCSASCLRRPLRCSSCLLLESARLTVTQEVAIINVVLGSCPLEHNLHSTLSRLVDAWARPEPSASRSSSSPEPWVGRFR